MIAIAIEASNGRPKELLLVGKPSEDEPRVPSLAFKIDNGTQMSTSTTPKRLPPRTQAIPDVVVLKHSDVGWIPHRSNSRDKGSK
jgi:hypothetical protein